MSDDMWATNQLQSLRIVDGWCFYNNGWWYKAGKRFCFYQDVNVPTDYLVQAHWMNGEETLTDTFRIQLDYPIAGFNKVREEEMSVALRKAESCIKKHAVEV